MREIKFRFWDTEENKWLGKDSSYFQELTLNDCRSKLVASLRKGHILAEQYTGLKDENGVEIYQGDILRSALGETCLTRTDKVVWLPNCCAFACLNTKGEFAGFLGELQGKFTSEVIGNIHESPELLDSRGQESKKEEHEF